MSVKNAQQALEEVINRFAGDDDFVVHTGEGAVDDSPEDGYWVTVSVWVYRDETEVKEG